VLVEGQFPVAAEPQSLMQHLLDARLMASCVPGCESVEAVDADSYRTVVVIAMAGIKARFDLLVRITGRDDFNVWATTRGEEGGQASRMQADSHLFLAPSPEGTVVNYRSEVAVTGRLGRFALGMMKKKAQKMGEEFAQNLRAALEAPLGASPADAHADAPAHSPVAATAAPLAAAAAPAASSADATGPKAAG
jgi:carbon monoxide dehydrogenase subunit G